MSIEDEAEAAAAAYEHKLEEAMKLFGARFQETEGLMRAIEAAADLWLASHPGQKRVVTERFGELHVWLNAAKASEEQWLAELPGANEELDVRMGAIIDEMLDRLVALLLWLRGQGICLSSSHSGHAG